MEIQLSHAILEHEKQPDWAERIRQEPIAHLDAAGLERRLSEYVGVEYCVCVASATIGMLLALKAAGVGAKDAVLCTSFSYFAIAEIIELAGARPVFVDINPNTYCIDPYCLEYVVGKCLRRNLPMPKALIAVDLFGLPCNYDALEETCERHGIILIEDMAQSFGASYSGRKAGSFGRMAVASFFPSKPLSEMGEGGAVFCHSLQDARRLQSLRRNICIGGDLIRGSHLDMVQASVVGEKLALFDLELKRRRQVAELYRERLEGAVRMQQIGPEYESAYTQFVISLKNNRLRERLMDRLKLSHIPCDIFVPSPVGRREQTQLDKVALVNAGSMAQRILTVPMHPYLSGRVVNYICDRILEELKPPGEPKESSDPEKCTG